MSQLPDRARVVVIGAGIVGNSIVHHLSGLGWRDIVLVDKGPLPNPGGSTGHASSFTFATDYSRQMTAWCLDSLRQFTDLGVFTRSGGIEVARTEERMEELKRRLSAAHAWGVEAELVSPKEIKQLVPYINEKVLLGGFHCLEVGVVDAVRAGTLMRDKATGIGALTTSPLTEVTGIEVVDGRVRSVRTDKGTIRTDTVVVCCGVWSSRIAEMAGASIPLVPAVHQMISVGPVPRFTDLPGEISFPVVRDMDALMYERQHGADMEVGSYAHRPILVAPNDIPSNDAALLSPTELPFTAADFDPQMEDALALIPEILADESVGIRHAINGLISLTADGYPILGETMEVKGLWSAAAMWIKEAPGIARTVAEWMTNGQPEIDPASANIARFYEHQKSRFHVSARGTEWFPKFYGIVHPAEQWLSDRDVRLSPIHEREKDLGAVFVESAGWERPFWYSTNERLLDVYGERVLPRDAEWDARWWSPIINAEHLALRERVGIVDAVAFAIFDVSGPGALGYLQGLVVNQVDVEVGRVVYAQLLNDAGGIRADVTIMRLSHDRFRVVTGGGTGMSDKKWLIDHLPDDGSAQLFDATSALTTIGIWGPRARDVLQSVTESDVSNDAFPFATCRTIEIGPIRTLASRISYVGELGWELYAPMEEGRRLWDSLWDAGREHGIVPVGLGAYGTTGRLEKGYRAQGNELSLDYDLVEAGLARPRVKDAEFVGKAAYLSQRSVPPAAALCTLTVDSHRSSDGISRHMLGGEPITTTDGQALVDAKGRRSFVTSAGSGPSIGKHILMSYLPPAFAVVGTRLAVEYFGDRYPVTVASSDATPLFDPQNLRVRQ
jgi:glycine cleavage system aminomethyltransferase T/glycine/D-amino acid oxidase-like deaminating enzyme